MDIKYTEMFYELDDKKSQINGSFYVQANEVKVFAEKERADRMLKFIDWPFLRVMRAHVRSCGSADFFIIVDPHYGALLDSAYELLIMMRDKQEWSKFNGDN